MGRFVIAAGLMVIGMTRQGPSLAPARAALGGDTALAAITSFAVTGSLTQELGAISTSSSVEISCVLPGQFLRITRRTAMRARKIYRDAPGQLQDQSKDRSEAVQNRPIVEMTEGPVLSGSYIGYAVKS